MIVKAYFLGLTDDPKRLFKLGTNQVPCGQLWIHSPLPPALLAYSALRFKLARYFTNPQHNLFDLATGVTPPSLRHRYDYICAN